MTINWKLLNKAGIIFFILILVGVIIKGLIINEIKLENDHRYTICETYEVEAAAEGSPHARIIYSVNGKQYKGFYPVYKIDKSLIGKRNFIKFYTKNPRNSKIIFDKEVPDEIIAPYSGWSALP